MKLSDFCIAVSVGLTCLFATPLLAQSIEGLDPAIAMQGEDLTLDVEVLGLTGITDVTIGPFVSSFTDDTTAGDGTVSVDVSVPLGATVAQYDVEMQYDGGTVSLVDGFDVTAAPSTDFEVLPATIVRGQTTTVYVRGAGLDAYTNVLVEGDDLSVTSFAAETDSQFSVRVAISDRAALGTRDVTLVGTPSITLSDVITIGPGPPDVFFVDPGEGTRGESYDLSIGGRNLDVVTTFSLGAGITISDYAATSATRATATADVGPAAPSGPHAATVRSTTGSNSLPGAFMVVGTAPALDAIAPASLTRGEEIEVELQGRNLDQVLSVDFGPRVSVLSFVASNPTRATALVSVREDAAVGVRSVILRTEGEDLTQVDAVTIAAGPVEVLRVRPDRIAQGTTRLLIIEGRNLDGITEVDAGLGVQIDNVDSVLPTEIEVEITTDTDAPVGQHDIRIVGLYGETSALDAITITPFAQPEVSLGFAEETTLEDTQVGTWRRRDILVENFGELEEVLTIGSAAGDVDLFYLLDDESRRVSSLSATLAPGEMHRFRVQFEPRGTTTNGVSFELSARDGEYASDVVIRGRGVARTLLLSPTSPADLGSVAPDLETALPRIDTLLADGAPLRGAVIEDLVPELFRDNIPIDSSEVFTFEWSQTAAGDTFFWGQTEFNWTANAPVGSYRGTLLFMTDHLTAPIVPLIIRVISTDDPTEDVGVDTGPDVGNDVGNDTGRDTSVDATTDTRPDTALDVSADTADAASDALDDTGDDVDGADNAPIDDGGCCAIGNVSATNGRRDGSLLLAGVVGLCIVRRRRNG